jgi:hypothetical protein
MTARGAASGKLRTPKLRQLASVAFVIANRTGGKVG